VLRLPIGRDAEVADHGRSRCRCHAHSVHVYLNTCYIAGRAVLLATQDRKIPRSRWQTDSTMAHALVVDSLRPRPGRRFQPVAELELVDAALGAAHGLRGADRGITVIREMTGPYGIPDLTAVVGEQAALERRLAVPVAPLLHQVDAGVVSVTSARFGRTSADLAHRLGWPTSTVERRLPHLLRSEALVRRPGDRFIRHKDLTVVGSISVVEAKVRDWRRAIRQVRTYATWADSYVLVMGPLGHGPTADLRHATARDRGGLLIDGRWISRPTRNPPAPPLRMWGSEYVVAALTGYQPSPAP
jgi:hypothetical protein